MFLQSGPSFQQVPLNQPSERVVIRIHMLIKIVN